MTSNWGIKHLEALAMIKRLSDIISKFDINFIPHVKVESNSAEVFNYINGVD